MNNLAASAADGMSLVCSDVEMLHREMIKANPSDAEAMNVLQILGKLIILEQEISQLAKGK